MRYLLFDKMTHFFDKCFFSIKLQIGGDTGTASSRNVSSSRSRTGEEPHIGKYRLLKTIGKGNFAKVKLAKHLPTGKEVKNERIKTFFVFSAHIFILFQAKFPFQAHHSFMAQYSRRKWVMVSGVKWWVKYFS